MSHVVTITTELRDLEAIKAACKRLNWQFKEGQTTYKWYGHSVGDYPMPAGMTEKDLGHCTHAIGVPGARYEIGLRHNGRSYAPVWDFWGSGGLPENAGHQLAQAYAAEKALRDARMRGYSVAEQTLPDGSIRLTINAGA